MDKRDDFTKETKTVLRDRVGGLCSRPECGRVTVSANIIDPTRSNITGRAAHITAARKGGPRFDGKLSAEQRRSAENGIWLCSDCADLIDKNAGASFKKEQLRSWKRLAEERQSVAALLKARATRPGWLDNLSTPHYVNVPRLLHLVGGDALSPAVLEALANGVPRGRMIIRELIEIEQLLRKMTIAAVDVQQITDPALQLMDGLVVSYWGPCRTKNGASDDPRHVKKYTFSKSPLIYVDSHGYRYIQPYDPIWLTTNTAYSTVRAGSLTLAGIAIIKQVDHLNKEVIASPLTFGIPNIMAMAGWK